MRKLCLMMLVAACGSNAASPDARAIDSAVGIDAAGRCDPTAPFGAPVPIAELNTTTTGEGCGRLSGDERTIYFYSNEAGGPGSNDLFSATRSDAMGTFGSPTPLSSLDTAADEFCPSVSENGLEIVFHTNRDPNQGYRIYGAQRTSPLVAFEAPAVVAGINSADVAKSDAQPFLSADGTELWFTSTRSGGTGGFDIYRAVAVNGSFVNPQPVTELNSNQDDYNVTLSADNLTVYFASARAGGSGGFDIWTSHRQTSGDGFPTPERVTSLETAMNEYPGWISADDCRLYFHSDRSGSLDLYVASR